ncbi:unnamed protein product [Lymnaea stagnalis]|uniref:VWFC domain-containing protein n=1 Tax=Lymnaea stagnalis TaxID=6523 RepID=A0AAV2I8W1_LYMST
MKAVYMSLAVLVTLALTEGCYYDGVTYLPGDQYNMDPCTWCTCGQDNVPLCMAAWCLMPQCEDHVTAVRRDGECCPRCPEGREMKP